MFWQVILDAKFPDFLLHAPTLLRNLFCSYLFLHRRIFVIKTKKRCYLECKNGYLSIRNLFTDFVPLDGLLYYSLVEIQNTSMSEIGSHLDLRKAWAMFTRPVDALPIDIFRVCVGVVVLAYFVRTFLEVADLSGPDGLLDHELILRMYWFTEIGIFRPWMGVEWFYAAFGIAVACCVPLILGYRVKLFSVILYIIAVSTYRHNFIVMYVDDAIMHLLLFWMLVLPVGRTLVLSEWLSDKRAAWERWKSVTVPGAPLRCFFWNLILLYLVAGLWKWTSPMWLDGTALYVVFKLPVSYFHEFWSAEHIPLLKIFNYGTLVLEPLVPLMFFLKLGSRLKYALLAAFIGLHILSALTLNIPFANIACAAVAILMFREELMQYLRGGVWVEPVGDRRFGLSGAVAMFMVVTLTLAMISSVTMMNWRTPPRVLKTFDTSATMAAVKPQLVDGRAEGMGSIQMAFFSTLWVMGIAQQYQLFNWIDDRNYSTHYRVVVGGNDVDPNKMFLRSLRGVLLDFYIHDIIWAKIPPEHREDLRLSILRRTAARYCRLAKPVGEVQVYSSLERIDPKGGPSEFENEMMMIFSCNERGEPVF